LTLLLRLPLRSSRPLRLLLTPPLRLPPTLLRLLLLPSWTPLRPLSTPLPRSNS
jgi:hypothetical protein